MIVCSLGHKFIIHQTLSELNVPRFNVEEPHSVCLVEKQSAATQAVTGTSYYVIVYIIPYNTLFCQVLNRYVNLHIHVMLVAKCCRAPLLLKDDILGFSTNVRKRTKRVEEIWPMEGQQFLGPREMPLGAHVGNPFPLRDQPHDGIVQNRVYSSHGRVKRVVEAGER